MQFECATIQGVLCGQRQTRSVGDGSSPDYDLLFHLSSPTWLQFYDFYLHPISSIPNSQLTPPSNIHIHTYIHTYIQNKSQYWPDIKCILLIDRPPNQHTIHTYKKWVRNVRLLSPASTAGTNYGNPSPVFRSEFRAGNALLRQRQCQRQHQVPT